MKGICHSWKPFWQGSNTGIRRSPEEVIIQKYEGDLAVIVNKASVQVCYNYSNLTINIYQEFHAQGAELARFKKKFTLSVP